MQKLFAQILDRIRLQRMDGAARRAEPPVTLDPCMKYRQPRISQKRNGAKAKQNPCMFPEWPPYDRNQCQHSRHAERHTLPYTQNARLNAETELHSKSECERTCRRCENQQRGFWHWQN